MKPMLVRTAVAGGTTLLALGLAGPALACPWGPGGAAQTTASHQDSTLTLAEYQARIDARITHWLTKIDAWEAKVAADDSLDPGAKTAKLEKLQAWEDKLLALQSLVAAETTLDGIKADLKAADLRVLWGFGHRFGHHSGHQLSGHHHSDGKHDKRGGDRSSDHRTRASGTKTADVSYVWGGRGGDGHEGARHGDRHDGSSGRGEGRHGGHHDGGNQGGRGGFA